MRQLPAPRLSNRIPDRLNVGASLRCEIVGSDVGLQPTSPSTRLTGSLILLYTTAPSETRGHSVAVRSFKPSGASPGAEHRGTHCMKPYLLSLGAGLLVGHIYSLLGIRSPAPPAIALVGLLGILVGEQALPYVKQHVHVSPAATASSASRANSAPKTQDYESIREGWHTRR